MKELKHCNTPPYIRPRYYTDLEEKERRIKAAKRAPTEWRNQAIFQGLIALGFVALGRASVRNGWPFWLVLSMGSMPVALEKSTQALSNYLDLRKQHLQK